MSKRDLLNYLPAFPHFGTEDFGTIGLYYTPWPFGNDGSSCAFGLPCIFVPVLPSCSFTFKTIQLSPTFFSSLAPRREHSILKFHQVCPSTNFSWRWTDLLAVEVYPTLSTPITPQHSKQPAENWLRYVPSFTTREYATTLHIEASPGSSLHHGRLGGEDGGSEW